SAPNKAASITSSRAPEFSRMWRSCRPREAVLIGTRLAPSQATPRKISMNSGRFSHISAMRSPALRPAACSRPAERAARPRACVKPPWRPPDCTSGLAPYVLARACSMTARLRSSGGKTRLASRGSRAVMAAPAGGLRSSSGLAVQIEIALQQRQVLHQLRLRLDAEFAEERDDPFLVPSRHAPEALAALARQANDHAAPVGGIVAADHQAGLHELVDQAGDGAVGHDQPARQLGHGEAVGKALELRQNVEARHRGLEFLAQALAQEALHLDRAADQTQPESQLQMSLQGRRGRGLRSRRRAVASTAHPGDRRFGDGLAHATYPSDDQRADAGAAAHIENLAGDEGRFAAGE